MWYYDVFFLIITLTRIRQHVQPFVQAFSVYRRLRTLSLGTAYKSRCTRHASGNGHVPSASMREMGCRECVEKLIWIKRVDSVSHRCLTGPKWTCFRSVTFWVTRVSHFHWFSSGCFFSVHLSNFFPKAATVLHAEYGTPRRHWRLRQWLIDCGRDLALAVVHIDYGGLPTLALMIASVANVCDSGHIGDRHDRWPSGVDRVSPSSALCYTPRGVYWQQSC